ncbi:MAG: chloride channel protein [Myxococcus sp.]|nr:chloride channel protein [Myxococcus sp.]
MSGRLEELDEEGLSLHRSWATVFRVAAAMGVLALVVWVVVSALRYLTHRAIDGLYQLSTAGVGGAAAVLGAMGLVAFFRGRLLQRAAWRPVIGDGVALARERAMHAPLDDDWRAPLGLAARKGLATLLTLGGGGSGGLEAPVVLMGEALGAGLAKLARVDEAPMRRLAQLCGVSAGVSTLLGAPFTAALFTLELMHGDRIVYRKLAYALWAAVIPFWLNTTLNGYRPLFVAPPHSPVYSLPEYGAAALVAIAVSAPLAFGFGAVMSWSRQLVGRVQPAWHALSTMLVVGALALVLQRFGGIELGHVLGAGEETLSLVLHNDPTLAVWWVLLVLIVAKTATLGLTLGGGGSAGLLFPSMFLGGLSGALVAQVVTLSGLATLDPALFAVVGIASSLTAVVGVPIAAMALVFEVFGKAYGPPTILACGLTFIATVRFRIWERETDSPLTARGVERMVARLVGSAPEDKEAPPPGA